MFRLDISSLSLAVHDEKTGNGIELSNLEFVENQIGDGMETKIYKCNLAAVAGRFSYTGPLWFEDYAENVLCSEDEHNRMGGYMALDCHEGYNTSLHLFANTKLNTIRIKGSFRHYKDEENTDQCLRLDMVIPDNGGFRRFVEGWERMMGELLGTQRTVRLSSPRK